LKKKKGRRCRGKNVRSRNLKEQRKKGGKKGAVGPWKFSEEQGAKESSAAVICGEVTGGERKLVLGRG